MSFTSDSPSAFAAAPRRRFLRESALALGGGAAAWLAYRSPARASAGRRAAIAITLDLEMSRGYPTPDATEWDYQKGNLDEQTKQYALKAADVARKHGGIVHFFCVGSVLEQPDVSWLRTLADAGHPIGNHTYDHVNIAAPTAASAQYRFQRAPWLVGDQTAPELVRENIRLAHAALKERCGIEARGFRTPGGFPDGLRARPDLQELIRSLGYTWVSSKYPPLLTMMPGAQPTAQMLEEIVAKQAESQPFVYPNGLVEIPMSPISDVNAFRTNRWQLAWFLDAIRASLAWAIDTGGVFDFLGHPSCLAIEDPDCRAVELICEAAREAGPRAALVDLDAIAANWSREAAR